MARINSAFDGSRFEELESKLDPPRPKVTASTRPLGNTHRETLEGNGKWGSHSGSGFLQQRKTPRASQMWNQSQFPVSSLDGANPGGNPYQDSLGYQGGLGGLFEQAGKPLQTYPPTGYLSKTPPPPPPLPRLPDNLHQLCKDITTTLSGAAEKSTSRGFPFMKRKNADPLDAGGMEAKKILDRINVAELAGDDGPLGGLDSLNTTIIVLYDKPAKAAVFKPAGGGKWLAYNGLDDQVPPNTQSPQAFMRKIDTAYPGATARVYQLGEDKKTRAMDNIVVIDATGGDRRKHKEKEDDGAGVGMPPPLPPKKTVKRVHIDSDAEDEAEAEEIRTPPVDKNEPGPT